MLSNTQKEIYNATDDKIVVIAAPASGKTRLLTEKVKKAIEDNEGRIVVITFTNAAAEEMSKRIGEKAKDMFIGTIHSYANYLLLSNGIDTNEYIQEEQFDELFELIRENRNMIEKVDYLFLDEAQDSTETQFEFILDMINPRKFFIVADHRQSIYGWNGGRPDILIDLTMEPDVVTYNLHENFRNGQNILEFARRLIRPLGPKYYDTSTWKSGIDGMVVEMDYRIPTLIKYIEQNAQYGKWFILTRTNSELDTVYTALENRDIPCESFKRAELDATELNKKLENDTVKVLTIHTAKGLENDYVAVIGARFYNPEERRIAYVAATRAKKMLLWIRPPKKKQAKTFSWE